MATTYDPTTADVGSVVKVPREDLVIDLNVRKDIRLDKSFVSSIRVRGFEQYPVGYVEDGKTHITVGQRRVSAALEIGWAVVPVIVKPRAAAEEDRAEEQRILTQLAENEQRSALTDAEIAAGYKSLALIGVSEDQIARKTNTGKQRVATALKVAGSEAATRAAAQLTLDQAAIYTEFEGDASAIAILDETAATKPQQLEHAAERIRNDRLDQAVRDRLEQEIRDAGFEVVHSLSAAGAEQINVLWRADDDTRTRLTLAKAKKYSGLVGAVGRSWSPKDRGMSIMWGIKDWKEQSLVTYGTRVPATEEEKAARRQKRQDKADMRAATAVRRDWIRNTLLSETRRQYPDDALAWIARELWHAPGTLRPSYGMEATFILEQLLGIETTTGPIRRDTDTGGFYTGHGQQIHDLITNTRDHLRLALAVAIGQTESVVGNEKGDAFGQDPRSAAYLRQLRDWGYVLADVEQRIVDAADQRALNEAITRDVAVGAGEIAS